MTARNRHPTFLRHTKSFVAIPWFLFALLAWFFLCASARAANAPSPARPGGFQFDTKISRPALENYLSRSICIEGMLNGRGPLPDDIRMLTNCGAKYVARALWTTASQPKFPATRLTQQHKREAKGSSPLPPAIPTPRRENLCRGCGKTIGRGALHCPKCGREVSGQNSQSSRRSAELSPGAQGPAGSTRKLNGSTEPRNGPGFRLPEWPGSPKMSTLKRFSPCWRKSRSPKSLQPLECANRTLLISGRADTARTHGTGRRWRNWLASRHNANSH